MVKVVDLPTQFLQHIKGGLIRARLLTANYLLTLTFDLLISLLTLYSLWLILLILNRGWYCISPKNVELLLETGY